jgi:hypothetical protein
MTSLRTREIVDQPIANWFVANQQITTLHNWRTPKLLDGLNCESKGDDNGKKRSWGALPGSQHFRGRMACWSFGMGLGKMISNLITHMNLHKPNNKLVSVELEHLWCTNEPRANTDSQNSPRPGLGGSHHLPPYNILCA